MIIPFVVDSLDLSPIWICTKILIEYSKESEKKHRKNGSMTIQSQSVNLFNYKLALIKQIPPKKSENHPNSMHLNNFAIYGNAHINIQHMKFSHRNGWNARWWIWLLFFSSNFSTIVAWQMVKFKLREHLWNHQMMWDFIIPAWKTHWLTLLWPLWSHLRTQYKFDGSILSSHATRSIQTEFPCLILSSRMHFLFLLHTKERKNGQIIVAIQTKQSVLRTMAFSAFYPPKHNIHINIRFCWRATKSIKIVANQIQNGTNGVYFRENMKKKILKCTSRKQISKSMYGKPSVWDDCDAVNRARVHGRQQRKERKNQEKKKHTDVCILFRCFICANATNSFALFLFHLRFTRCASCCFFFFIRIFIIYFVIFFSVPIVLVWLGLRAWKRWFHRAGQISFVSIWFVRLIVVAARLS